MNAIARIAFRNLGRNRRRTLITGAGIALGVGMCIAVLGIMEGLSAELINGTTDGQLGHIQVHHPDYLGRRQLLKTVSEAPAVSQRIASQAGVEAVSGRLYGWAYLSFRQRAVGVQLLGVEPGAEGRVTRLPRQIVAGNFLPPAATPWPASHQLSAAQQAHDKALTEQAIANAFDQLERLDGGKETAAPAGLAAQTQAIVEQIAPSPSQPPAVVLGSKLASNLGARPGDLVTLLYENAQGAQLSLMVKVVGISRTGTDLLDRTRTLLHLADLQQMLGLPGQVHELAIRARQPQQAQALAGQLQQLLKDGQPLAVQDWSALRPDILALITSNRMLMGSLVFIVFLIAGSGVLNTMLMSVLERQKELSMMKALGLSAPGVTALVLLETLALTLLASLTGLLLGLGLILYLQQVGWDIRHFGEFSLSGVEVAPVLRARLTAGGLLIPLLAMWVISLLAALHPAIRAARISPALGMRAA
ncbi:ABC transporter permease [Chitinimonas arctica]|uniref:ABC transporter permease n=1 Tax=Chitinimonas arctica TaxID=2594795 RepID=A0A516SCU4_9NEIS|nr:ABC transporter permease [Chitinimonas arctica]QDQ25960.1 ABC transporter permease [Chitinimonas arctica]